MDGKLLSVSSINGSNVKNSSGENIGKIKDLMLDTKKGQIAYAVLSFGGLLGIGDKYFAIPWKAFSFSKNNEHCLLLNVPKEKLKEAPGFNKRRWPAYPKDGYLASVYTYYGYPLLNNHSPNTI